MKTDHPVSGSCLCGTVTFELDSLDRDVVYCHCIQCRKQTGHVVAATRTKDEHLNVKGENNLTWYPASEQAKRAFCKHCGSLLFWKRNNSDKTSIMAGSLDAPTKLSSACHIYTEFKGDYYEIADRLPQHEATD